MLLLTVLSGLALLWVLRQMVSPIAHTLILFGLAAVLAFALSGPVNLMAARIGNRLFAIVAVYVLVGVVVVGGLTLLAGPFVREATALTGALPQYAAELQARAPGVQNTLGQYGVQTDVDQLKARATTAVEQGAAEVLKNLVGTLAEIGGIILDIVLALVISLYLLIDGPRFRARSLALVPVEHRAKALFLEDNVSRVLGGYLRGQLTLAVIIGVAAGAGTATAGLAVRRGAWRAGRTVRAGANVWTDSIGDSRSAGRTVLTVSHRIVGCAVFSRRAADRKQHPFAAHKRPCRGAASAGRDVRIAGRLSARRAAGWICSPSRWQAYCGYCLGLHTATRSPQRRKCAAGVCRAGAAGLPFVRRMPRNLHAAVRREVALLTSASLHDEREATSVNQFGR